MSYSYVDIAPTATGSYKPYFSTNGNYFVSGFSLPAHRLSSDGAYCSVFDQMTTWMSGGLQRMWIADVNGGASAYSAFFDPTGGADSSSARQLVGPAAMSKAAIGGNPSGYWAGVHCDSSNGVGMYRSTTGGGYQLNAAFAFVGGNIGGELKMQVYYSIVPAAPTLNSAIADPVISGRVNLTFTWSGDNGGSANTGTRIQVQRVSDGVVVQDFVQAGGSSTRAITGLTDGVAYRFTVFARNGVSDAFAPLAHASPASNQIIATPGAAGGKMGVYSGSVFAAKTIKVFEPTVDDTIKIMRYNGTSFVEVGN